MHCPETKDKRRLEGKRRLDTYYKRSEILLKKVQNLFLPFTHPSHDLFHRAKN